MATSAWPAFRWMVLGIFCFMLGVLFTLAGLQVFPLWLNADHYVAGELEVTRFDAGDGRPRRTGRTIEGVIHPSGEPVRATEGDIDIAQFVDPDDITGRRVPARNEIEGRRLAVLYWPEQSAVKRPSDLPQVVMPGATQGGGLVLRQLSLGIAFVGVSVLCVRRGYRYVKSASPGGPQSDVGHA